MTTITPEQRIAVNEAGDSPVELADLQTGDSFILVRAEVDRRLLEDAQDHREHEAWGKTARKARNESAAVN